METVQGRIMMNPAHNGTVNMGCLVNWSLSMHRPGAISIAFNRNTRMLAARLAGLQVPSFGTSLFRIIV